MRVLFTGPRGTGKTLAARVLARELQMPIYQVNLSQVVSKDIGETEKNLRRIFDAVENAGAILLVDEADALFGKRSEVKDSLDRYANRERDYLWERIEGFNGVVIASANRLAKIDDAFRRRFRCIIPIRAKKPACDRELQRSVIPHRRTKP